MAQKKAPPQLTIASTVLHTEGDVQVLAPRPFMLPIEAVTETFAFIGTRGGGKTYGCKVMVEEMLAAGLHVVVLDPMHAWWGLRATAEGKPSDFDLAIIGGERGDVPVEAAAGELVANLIVGEKLSGIIDIADMSKTQRRQFVVDFAERLYKINREPLHLVVEEADMFVPQNARGEERMEGAFEDLVRRGRGRGIGISLLSQRPQVVNKNVLDLTENFVAFRAKGTRSREAIREWFDANATPEELKVLTSSLPSLGTGEAWFYSAHFLGVMQRVQFRPASTFDSSATPKPGQTIRPPKKLSEVNLPALRDAMAATIEKQKMDDPRELRRRISELERELRDRPDAAPAEPEIIHMNIPVLNDDAAEKLREAVFDMRTALGGVGDRIEQQIARAEELVAETLNPSESHTQRVVAAIGERLGTPIPPPRVGDVAAAMGRDATERDDKELMAAISPITPDDPTPSEQRILGALAWLESIGLEPATRMQVGFLAKYRPTGGRFSRLLGEMKTRGFVTYPRDGLVERTPLGHHRTAERPRRQLSPEDLQEAVLERVTPSHRAILRPLIDAYPREMARAVLAAEAGYEPTGGRFSRLLGELKTLQLVDYPGPAQVIAADFMFLTTGG